MKKGLYEVSIYSYRKALLLKHLDNFYNNDDLPIIHAVEN
jgi:hypothetical protein